MHVNVCSFSFYRLDIDMTMTPGLGSRVETSVPFCIHAFSKSAMLMNRLAILAPLLALVASRCESDDVEALGS